MHIGDKKEKSRKTQNEAMDFPLNREDLSLVMKVCFYANKVLVFFVSWELLVIEFCAYWDFKPFDGDRFRKLLKTYIVFHFLFDKFSTTYWVAWKLVNGSLFQKTKAPSTQNKLQWVAVEKNHLWSWSTAHPSFRRLWRCLLETKREKNRFDEKFN